MPAAWLNQAILGGELFAQLLFGWLPPIVYLRRGSVAPGRPAGVVHSLTELRLICGPIVRAVALKRLSASRTVLNRDEGRSDAEDDALDLVEELAVSVAYEPLPSASWR